MLSPIPPLPTLAHAAWMDKVLGILPILLFPAFASPRYGALQRALRRDNFPTVAAALLLPSLPRLAVLLSLPPDRRPAGVSWHTARTLAGTLISRELATEVQVGSGCSAVRRVFGLGFQCAVLALASMCTHPTCTASRAGMAGWRQRKGGDHHGGGSTAGGGAASGLAL